VYSDPCSGRCANLSVEVSDCCISAASALQHFGPATSHFLLELLKHLLVEPATAKPGRLYNFSAGASCCSRLCSLSIALHTIRGERRVRHRGATSLSEEPVNAVMRSVASNEAHC